MAGVGTRSKNKKAFERIEQIDDRLDKIEALIKDEQENGDDDLNDISAWEMEQNELEYERLQLALFLKGLAPKRKGY